MGGFSSGIGHLPLVVVHVHLHLAQVLVGQVADLEVDEHEAAGEAVVEDEVDEEVLALQRDPLLPGHEGEPLAQLQEELLELVDEGLLQVRLQEAFILPQAGEFQDVGILDQVSRAPGFMAPLSQGHDAGLVAPRASRSKSMEWICRSSSRVDHRASDRLGLVERPCLGLVDPEKQPIVGPRQFSTQCVAFRGGQVERPHVLQVRRSKPLPKSA